MRARSRPPASARDAVVARSGTSWWDATLQRSRHHSRLKLLRVRRLLVLAQLARKLQKREREGCLSLKGRRDSGRDHGPRGRQERAKMNKTTCAEASFIALTRARTAADSIQKSMSPSRSSRRSERSTREWYRRGKGWQ